jgi:hypothetical protein
VLHAPVAGVVSAINGTVGEFVDAASATTSMAPGSSARLPESSDDDSAATADSGGSAFITLDNLITFQLPTPFQAGTVGDEYTQVASGLREGQELLLLQTQQTSTSDTGGGPGG